MKKTIVLFLACSIFSNVVYAVSDTVRYGDTCYLFHELHSPLSAWTDNTGGWHPYLSWYWNGSREFGDAKLYVAKSSVPIYGVATTMLLSPEDDTVTTWYTAYLLRYTNAQLEVVDSSTAYSVKNWFLYSAVHEGQLLEEYVPCLEFYFGQPHYMTDSFAVVTVRKEFMTSGYTGPGNYSLIKGITSSIDDREFFYYPPTHSFRRIPECGKFFPIIQPERIGCEAAVADMRERSESHAVLEWDMEGDSCQLSIVPYNQPVDSAAVVDLTDSSYTATGLSTGIYYAARLRTQCHHRCHIHADTVVWSDWGAPTLFYVGEHEPDTGGVGIRHAESLPEVSLTPNPAHGSATVRCEEGIRSVELLTVKGERILYQDMAGEQTCTLDLGGLSKGVYIVQVTTEQGTAARKLAVE